MAIPANRAKIRLVRGNYADIVAGLSSLVDGELCYAKDRNKLYMVEEGALTSLDYLAVNDVEEAVQDAIVEALSGGTGIDITYNDVTNTISFQLDETAVNSGTYGDSSTVAVFTVDEQGRIVGAENVSIDLGLEVAADNGSVQTVLLPSETLTISGDTGITTTTTSNGVSIDLDDTTVTPGTYGTSTTIPSLTIDQQGRITSATTNSIVLGLDVSADTGTTQTISFGSETLALIGDTGITTTTTTNGVKIDLDDTAVTVGTYGSATSIPVVTIDQQGRITSASTETIGTSMSVAADSGTAQSIIFKTETLNILGGTGLSSTTGTNSVTINLDNTNVTAGTYGTATTVPSFTVDAQGRITSVNTLSIPLTLTVNADGNSSDGINLSSEQLTITGDTGITTSITGNTLKIDLDDTTVTIGTYGSSSAIPTITVDQQGRITSIGTASISTSLGVAGDTGSDTISLASETLTVSGGTGLSSVATANKITVNLDNTSVTAGNYGSSTAIPVLSIDAQGRITSASTSTISTTLSISGDDTTSGSIALGSDILGFVGSTDILSKINGDNVEISLKNTGVSAGTYGSSTSIPTITVDNKGRISSVSTNTISTTLGLVGDNATNGSAIIGTNALTFVGDTGITASVSNSTITIDLDDTTVTAGSYGTANSTTAITVDSTGRITSAASTPISITASAVSDFSTQVRKVSGQDQSFEPMGHADRTQSTISFNTSTRTFTIAPVGASYDVWCKGIKFTKTSAETVVIPNTTGLYYIYFDSTGQLSYRTSYFDWDDDTPTSYLYWDATSGTTPYFADERHGITLDWATHEYLHRTRGAVLASGFSISNYTTTGDGSLDSHAQIDLSGGVFFDEDLRVSIVHSDTPAANSWQQDLIGPAKIPSYYLSGVTPVWKKDTATNFPLKPGTSRPQYNLLSGGSWSTVDAGDNKYIVSFILATHNLNEPVISVIGQGEYSNIGDAEGVDFSDLILTNFPSSEFRPLYKLIFQTGSYANTIKARLRSVVDIRQTGAVGSSQAIGADHGALSGLGDDDHLQYLHATTDRTGITANITTSGTLKTTNATASTSASTGALVVTGGAGIGGDLFISGNLTISGTTTTLNTETIVVEDANIQLGTVGTPTDTTANGGGFTLLGATTKTFAWNSGTGAWTSSEHIDLANSKSYYINGSQVLSANTLGAGITSSSLTSVGTITAGTWNGTTIGYGYGGTGYTSYADGQILIGKTDGSLAKTTLSAGANISILNGDGSISISSVDTTYTAGSGLSLTGTVFAHSDTSSASELTATSRTYVSGLTFDTFGHVTGYTTGTETVVDTTYTAGDGLDLTGTSFSLDIKQDTGLVIDNTELAIDLKVNGGLVVESSKLAVDLGATSITGTLATTDGGTGQTTYSSGQLLIGNNTGGLTKSTITAGTNVSVDNGNGSITISSTDTTYLAGDGLDLAGTTFAVDLKASGGLVIESTELALDLSASSITGTLGVADGGTGLSGVAKGSILVANTLDTISALDGGGSTDKILIYDNTTDTVSWVTEIDGGTYVGAS